MAVRLVRNDQGGGRETMGQRLRRAREIAGYSGPELAKRIGITRSALSQMELDQSGINQSNLDRAVRLLYITEDWLRFGVGRGPRAPEQPIMVPEIDMNHEVSVSLTKLLQHRSGRFFAMPASEAVDLDPNKLIAARVNEDFGHDYRAGDFVILNAAIHYATRDGIYGVANNGQYGLCAIRRSQDQFEVFRPGQQSPQLMSAEDLSVIGPVVFSYHRRSAEDFANRLLSSLTTV